MPYHKVTIRACGYIDTFLIFPDGANGKRLRIQQSAVCIHPSPVDVVAARSTRAPIRPHDQALAVITSNSWFRLVTVGAGNYWIVEPELRAHQRINRNGER